MATSGTYSFAPATADLIMLAFARIGLARTQLLQEHFLNAQREANLWLGSISNMGPNLWTVDLQTQVLVEGTATYSVPASTVMILDPYIRTGSGDSVNDRVISPISRTDYASLPNKESQGQPTSFWFNRQISPTISLWPVPDGNGPYTLRYYRYRQVQDANLQNAENVEIPYLFFDAFVAALAYRMARIYAPALEAARKLDAQEAWDIAATQNVENAPMAIYPGLSSYFS